MDWGRIIEKLLDVSKRYRYVLLVVLIGIILISIPDGASPKPAEVDPQEELEEEPDLETQLEDLLCNLSGAGRVRVLLTKASGEEIRYQSDESNNDSSNHRSETVIISDSQRKQSGLVRQIIPPTYLGAVILCEGADRPDVCLSVSKAVASATGLSFDKITVLKLK